MNPEKLRERILQRSQQSEEVVEEGVRESKVIRGSNGLYQVEYLATEIPGQYKTVVRMISGPDSHLGGVYD